MTASTTNPNASPEAMGSTLRALIQTQVSNAADQHAQLLHRSRDLRSSLQSEHYPLGFSERDTQTMVEKLDRIMTAWEGPSLAEHNRLKPKHAALEVEHAALEVEHDMLKATLLVEHDALKAKYANLKTEHDRLMDAELKRAGLPYGEARKAMDAGLSTSFGNGKDKS